MVSLTLECGSEDRAISISQNFEWLQLSYLSLRASPDGGDVAYYNEGIGWWFIDVEFAKRHGLDPTARWSDIIIN